MITTRDMRVHRTDVNLKPYSAETQIGIPVEIRISHK